MKPDYSEQEIAPSVRIVLHIMIKDDRGAS